MALTNVDKRHQRFILMALTQRAQDLQYLVMLDPGSTFWTDEQSRKNFQNVSNLVNRDDPMSSKFLLHPLSPMAGGDITFVHGGGRQFASKQDPDWQTIAAWVSGRKVASSPGPK